MGEIPKKYKPADAVSKWSQLWDEWGIHRWDSNAPRENTFVVDTPPPTVSGSLHIGHVFSYTHQDLLVRYQRMKGKNIFYGMGWDDNGLPTERRVQNIFGIRCEPRLPYDPDWQPRRDKKKKDPIEEISRRNFIESCGLVTVEDEAAFEDLWRNLGLSIDWNETYATIDEDCRRGSQRSFLDLVEKGAVYQTKSPTMWDIDFKTAVAQAEVEDRELGGFMHEVEFQIEGGDSFVISTTRPELLPACIAVVAHPDDERFKPLFGKHAITPLFGARVPILAAEHADPEKGTGILMVCTFGDSNDVDWWKQSGLPVKQVIGMNGRLREITFGDGDFESTDAATAQAAYAEICGKTAKQAKKRIAELLSESGALKGEPEAISHPVKFYEKGDRPLEFVPTRQWFIRILDQKDELLAQGRKIDWYPSHMRVRFERWVEGLNQDWCVSRQRYFGVPLPVWYPLGADGEADFEHPIFGDSAALPIDPLSETPPGFDESQRNQPGGFMGDPDVMDTWATSSISPMIQSKWGEDDERHTKLFPMDIRPQSHEIIRTWAFYTIVKAWLHEKEIPWKNVIISGWILDPDRKKMSKSKGNVVTPDKLLEQHSVDGIRYWAGRARLGTDTALDESVFKVGKRLATKVFNASRFVFMQIESGGGLSDMGNTTDITCPLDIACVAKLRGVVASATESFERFEYASALAATEDGFWGFCDHYLELVKNRSYSDDDSTERRSALATLGLCVRSYLRLLAPFIPFVTEEVWSWHLSGEGRLKSIHTSPWPTADEYRDVPMTTGPEAYDAAVEVLTQIRGAKSDAQRSLNWKLTALSVTGTDEAIASVTAVLPDLQDAGGADDAECTLVGGAEADSTLTVSVELAPPPPTEHE